MQVPSIVALETTLVPETFYEKKMVYEGDHISIKGKLIIFFTHIERIRYFIEIAQLILLLVVRRHLVI